MGVTATTIRADTYLRCELDDVGFVANIAKTVVLPLSLIHIWTLPTIYSV